MSNHVRVRMVLPFAAQDGFDSSIAFAAWLPLTDADAIHVEKDGLSLVLKFTAECTDFPEYCDDLSSWGNPSFATVIAEVTAIDVPEELRQRIQEFPEDVQLPPEEAINSPHGAFGRKVMSCVLHCVNRLIAYVRDEKGQHALVEFPSHPTALDSAFRANGVQVKVGKSSWNRWVPPSGEVHYTLRGYKGDRRRRVSHEDWQKIVEFVQSSAKPPLVGHLLSGADNLAAHGHRREALTQAVTALEVRTNEFASAATDDATVGEWLKSRVIDVKSLPSLVDKLGLRGTIRFLLPLLLDEKAVSRDLLRVCSDAINDRHTVIHKGQRDVKEERIEEYLMFIRSLCITLDPGRWKSVSGWESKLHR